ncbi:MULTISPECIES: hypothetical protein [Sporosarcina]|uniref:hypothetical protein n=1 Tax=Sporosarcina TaxID=1569 RepID=UPI00058F93E4|nr:MULTISPECIES: hypothetical protein [Sporosarcina]WJY26653.1 hypothetical protein QWT68_11265 [Sporosarcina sp. 0.2-SM1T-5]
MTIHDNKYPNKRDLEPKVPKKGKPAGPTEELPLSDPADSNYTHVVHEPGDTAGAEDPTADGQTKVTPADKGKNGK